MVSATMLVLAGTVGLLLVLTAVAWRNRQEPGARVFGLMQATAAVWAGLTAVGLATPPGPVRVRIWGVTTGLSLLVIVLWLGFILNYTGRETGVVSWKFGLVSAPFFAGAVAYFVAPAWPVLVGRLEQTTVPAGTLVDAGVGPVGGMLGLYIYLVFGAGLVLVLLTVLRGERLFAGQAAAFVLGTLMTVVASVLVIAGVPVDGYPLIQVALAGQSLLWGYAVFRQRLMEAVPALARIGERAVVDELDDGVLVVDDGGTVVRANPRARAHLGRDDLVGRQVETVLDRVGVSSLAALPARFQRQGRTYQAKVSAVTNRRGEPIGRALVVREVTRLVRRQQRLEVLNRVLRHNLRNDMNVVLAVGDRLRKRGDEDLVALGEKLDRTAAGLTTVSEKAIEIDRIFDESVTVDRFPLDDLVEKVVSTLADQHPDATVTTAVTAGEIRTDYRLLSLVLTEVVENALVHAGEAPDVRAEVSRADGHVEVAVSDDGPGIPSAETDPLSVGTETDLRHASSLGLWLVNWGTQSLGGSVEVATTAAGSTVTLSVPDLAETDPEGVAVEPDSAPFSMRSDGDLSDRSSPSAGRPGS
jgi:signal transduction histidine kinase